MSDMKTWFCDADTSRKEAASKTPVDNTYVDGPFDLHLLRGSFSTLFAASPCT
jgi:hypothetical protein